MSEWICTKDRLPFYGESCLIVYQGCTQHITYYLSDEDGLWWPCDETSVEIGEGMECDLAEYWQPLPQYSQ